MANSWSEDAGTIQALLERLNTQRLPRALELKEKVNRGERLDTADIQFLQRVLEDASSAQRLAAKHGEFQELVGRLISLYSEITSKGLENEKKEVKPWQ
jgi:hypothetical protein